MGLDWLPGALDLGKGWISPLKIRILRMLQAIQTALNLLKIPFFCGGGFPAPSCLTLQHLLGGWRCCSCGCRHYHLHDFPMFLHAKWALSYGLGGMLDHCQFHMGMPWEEALELPLPIRC